MSFKKVLGQERQIQILKNAIHNKRVPHAYLFVGIEGIGKKLTALAMAKALNCNNYQLDSCGQCHSCEKIDLNNHLDVNILEPDGDVIKIDQIRGLKEELHYKSFEGGKKVYIINNAEKINLQAANALLKVLEEPSKNSVLILIAANDCQLLPTIISRCQKLKFQPMPSDLIAKIIEEKMGKGKEFCRLAALLSEGSLGKAFSMDEDQVFRQRKGLIRNINHLFLNNLSAVLKAAEEMAADKNGLERILDFLKIWFRDLLVFKITKQSNTLVNFDLMSDIKSIATILSLDALLNNLKVINEVQIALKKHSNPRLTLEAALFKMRLAE